MSGDPGAIWRLSLDFSDEASAELAAAALQSAAEAVSVFEVGTAGGWRVEAYAGREPDRAALAANAALLALASGRDLLEGLVVERLAPRDWLLENRQSFPPLRVARFFIHGSHYEGKVPAGAIGLRLDAATAFGTGEHATTRGCLIALAALARRRRFRRPLDMGTGTGILAMAAARLWPVRVLASDIDGRAVEVARLNCRTNGLTARVRALRCDGYRDRRVVGGAPYDLVLANILARPLVRMAKELGARLAPGGVAILSGLLSRQVPQVLAAHRAQGLRLCARLRLEGWETLILSRGVR